MIRITGMKLLPAMLLAVSIMLPAAASAEGIYDHISGTIAGSDLAPGQPYFDQKHDASWVAPALGRLSGQAMGDSVSNGEAIAMIQAQLASLPEVAVMQNKMAELPIPQWYLTGYRDNQPTKLAKSRYMNGVLDGSLEMEPDIAALYGFWCCYDAEWFVLSSDPELRAWLGAVMLSYADDWQRLDSESAESLHNRLVKPIQTKDEPYREIDNWMPSRALMACSSSPRCVMCWCRNSCTSPACKAMSVTSRSVAGTASNCPGRSASARRISC